MGVGQAMGQSNNSEFITKWFGRIGVKFETWKKNFKIPHLDYIWHWLKKLAFFYYLVYFCCYSTYFWYYSLVSLHFLVLFMGPSVLFQLPLALFTLLLAKLFQFQLNKLFPNRLLITRILKIIVLNYAYEIYIFLVVK